MRATYYTLLARVYTLNEVLGRPVQQIVSAPGEPIRFSIGNLNLSHDTSGYGLEETTSESGAVSVISCSQTAHEMDIFITGIMKGIGFSSPRLYPMDIVEEPAPFGYPGLSKLQSGTKE